jgi:hypothetical protein
MVGRSAKTINRAYSGLVLSNLQYIKPLYEKYLYLSNQDFLILLLSFLELFSQVHDRY